MRKLAVDKKYYNWLRKIVKDESRTAIEVILKADGIISLDNSIDEAVNGIGSIFIYTPEFNFIILKEA